MVCVFIVTLPVWPVFYVQIVRLVPVSLASIRVCSTISSYLYCSADHAWCQLIRLACGASILPVPSTTWSGYVWNCMGQWCWNTPWRHRHRDRRDVAIRRSAPEIEKTWLAVVSFPQHVNELDIVCVWSYFPNLGDYIEFVTSWLTTLSLETTLGH